MIKTEPEVSIERGITKIIVPHQGGELVVSHPVYGPSTAKNLRDSIRADGLREATASQTVSALRAMYGHKSPEGMYITALMEEESKFITFTAMFRGEEKVDFVDYPRFDRTGDIFRRLDGRVARTMPLRDLREGFREKGQISRDPYLISLFGEEGAKKTEGLARKHLSGECGIFLPPQERGTARIITLSSSDSINGPYLKISGEDSGRSSKGYAFGVFES